MGSMDVKPLNFVVTELKKEAVEKPDSQRLVENVHMQGFRNPEE